jgi:hypothetical protein
VKKFLIEILVIVLCFQLQAQKNIDGLIGAERAFAK